MFQPVGNRRKRRGTTNRNHRGNTKDREARRKWLLKTYASDVRPNTCRCYRCGCLLDARSLTVDRIIPSVHGGTYRRNNIRPACAFCNSEVGGGIRK